MENARFYALLASAIDDVGIAITIAKYDHAFWRQSRRSETPPPTAMPPVPDWEPLLPTPLHPEYPCGHCIFAAVTAEIIAAEFGREPEGGLTIRNPAFPGVSQTFKTTDAYAQAIADSRNYGGAHFRFSNEAAQQMGQEIARAASEHVLQPIADRR